jgi:hypothetical protein
VDALKGCELRPSDPGSDEDQLQALLYIVLCVMSPEGVVLAFRYVNTYRNSVQDRLSASINPGRKTTPPELSSVLLLQAYPDSQDGHIIPTFEITVRVNMEHTTLVAFKGKQSGIRSDHCTATPCKSSEQKSPL